MSRKLQEYKIGVSGAGAMGSGIAQLAASFGHTVVLHDVNVNILTRAKEKIETNLKTQVQKGRIDEVSALKTVARIDFSEDIGMLSRSDLVIEAVIEDLAVKQNIFKQLESVVSSECMLASNTSSLSIASIASACKQPERVLGMHFFNPAPVMPLVEVIPAVHTLERFVQPLRKLLESWNKSAVVAKDTPGFIVNRIARPFYGESLRLLEEGVADIATIDWAMREVGGFRMGPFELMDFIGNDINYRVTESVFGAFYYDPRYRPSILQRRLVEAGLLGRKSGRGFYNYASDSEVQHPHEDQALGKEIFYRVLAMLINEAADSVFLKIASIEDVELAMTKGVNYPKGLLKWADELGLKKVVAWLDDLREEYGEERYRASPLLRRMAKAGQKFYA